MGEHSVQGEKLELKPTAQVNADLFEFGIEDNSVWGVIRAVSVYSNKRVLTINSGSKKVFAANRKDRCIGQMPHNHTDLSSCCSSNNHCWEGEGDCDLNTDCARGLFCGVDNCQGKEWEGMSHHYDCCVRGDKNIILPWIQFGSILSPAKSQVRG